MSDFNCNNCIYREICPGYHVTMPDCKLYKDEALFLELPCKVGDTVWYHKIIMDGKSSVVIEHSEVKQISINSHGAWLVIEYCHTLDVEDIGKTVFLTHEEAQQALKENSNES